MNLSRALKVMAKDLKLGPRSPAFLYALVFPVVATVLVQVVFGSLFDPKPRLGIVHGGDSRIPTAAAKAAGIDLTLLSDTRQLKARVEANDLDAGLVLPLGFDAAVRSGERPLLEFYIGGESLAANRVVLAMATVDWIRDLEGAPNPVEVDVQTVGNGDALPISSRLVPFLVIFALLISGVFVPASSLVEEKEKLTLTALLVTPVQLPEVLLAKAGLGLVLSSSMALFTLALNHALGSQPWALAAAILVAAVMTVEIGVIYGTVAKNAQALFAMVKSLNLLLLAPVVFYVFPDWPQWIAKLFPTYWILDPIFEVAVKGSGLTDVWVDLTIALVICAALIPVLGVLARRMQRNLGVT